MDRTNGNPEERHAAGTAQEETAANYVSRIEACRDLSASEAEQIMEELLQGRLAHAEIVRLLIALRTKGEAVEELVGFARAIRRHTAFAAKLASPETSAKLASGVAAETAKAPLVDTCGTGGDGGGTFNVSTAAALVVAGAGVRVAKHGNRSFSSRCGSADVFEALGLNLNAPPQRVFESIEQIGIGFLFAPLMHTAMKHAMTARREAGGRTVFNLLGPLTNPAGARVQVVGVPAPALVGKIGHALAELHVRRAFVVHGIDGIDEVSLSTETEVADVRPHSVQRYRIGPADFGVEPADRDALTGGDAAANAAIITQILEGEAGPRRDFVCINAALALVAAERANRLAEGVRLAREAIDSGAARAKLQAMVELSRKG